MELTLAFLILLMARSVSSRSDTGDDEARTASNYSAVLIELRRL